ncbi:MAG: hypothetical protein LBS98_01810 [Coriobacteriales bacterium]|nr:hypothetical protein [Coriobacteriales bacterium]
MVSRNLGRRLQARAAGVLALSVVLILSSFGFAFGDFVVATKVLGVGRIQAVTPSEAVEATDQVVVTEPEGGVSSVSLEAIAAPIEREVVIPEPEPDPYYYVIFENVTVVTSAEAESDPNYDPDAAFSADEAALASIISRESGGNPWSENGQYKGIGQLHYNYYPKYVGLTWEECAGNYDIQLTAMRMYIAERYGTASNAWYFWQMHSWY